MNTKFAAIFLSVSFCLSIRTYADTVSENPSKAEESCAGPKCMHLCIGSKSKNPNETHACKEYTKYLEQLLGKETNSYTFESQRNYDEFKTYQADCYEKSDSKKALFSVIKNCEEAAIWLIKEKYVSPVSDGASEDKIEKFLSRSYKLWEKAYNEFIKGKTLSDEDYGSLISSGRFRGLMWTDNESDNHLTISDRDS